jgi:hypothetical protein
MDADPHRRFVAALEQLVALTSTACQACQLAAQQADLEGQALPAAVFRSISESYAGTSHGLLQVLAGMDNPDAGVSGATARNARDVLARQAGIEGLAQELSAAAAAALGPQRAGDLAAMLKLTAANPRRLDGMLRSLPAATAAEAAG